MPARPDDPGSSTPPAPSELSARRPWIDYECHRGDLDEHVLASITDLALARISTRLTLDVSAVRPVHLIVADGANRCVDHVIWIDPPAPGRGYSVYDWFELLFTHELTHLLVRDAWGMPAVLWWEGLAVHLGDDGVRARLFGRSYHTYCRALAEHGALLPLEPLLRASTYYRRRTDFRVDLQAGSFCAFLLDAYGPSCVGRFVTECPRPASEPAAAIVDPIARRHFGDDFHELCARWVRFLRTDVACDPSLAEGLRARRLGETQDGTPHCDHCFEHTTLASVCERCSQAT